MGAEEGLGHLFGRTRYVILVLSLLCLTFAFANSLVFTFTVICMDDVIPNNSTDHWLQSPSKVNSLFSAIAIGCLIGTIPISYLVQLWGIGYTCAIYGIFSALGTFFFPVAVNLGYPAVFFVRILQGIPTSLSFPAQGQIPTQWATEKGLGSFMSILSIYMQLCSVFTMPITSAFCTSSLGWRSAYYVHGVLSMFIFLCMFFFYSDNPANHRTVSERELHRISRGKTNQAKSKAVPYKAMLTDSCLYAILISLLGSTSGYQVFLLYGPTYLNKVLGLDVRATGWGTALPFALSAFVKFFLGPISDKASCVSPRTRLVFFTLLSQGMLSMCFVIMATTTSTLLAQIAYTGAIVASGLVAVGTFRGASVVFRQHVHFMMSIASFLLVLIVLVLPQAVALFCPDNTPQEWSRLFIFFAVFVVALSTPYAFFARSEPADYTVEKVHPVEEKKTKEIENEV